MKKLVSILLIFLFCVPFFAGCDEKTTEEPFDYAATYYADIVVKEYGTITLELDAENTPITVKNFVTLAKSGFYNGLSFNKFADGAIEIDAPDNKVNEYTKYIYGEFEENGYPNRISHKRGVISMARDRGYNYASSRFFILKEDNTGLDGKYAAFGWVVSGMDIIDKMYDDAVSYSSDSSKKQPIIESITIREEENE